MKHKPSNQSHDMSPDEMADFEENVIHGDGVGDAGDRLTKSGRVRLEDVKEAIKKSDTPARRPRRKVTA